MDVLLVEDEAPIREAVGEGLRSAGFDVLTASSAEEALAAMGDRAWPRVVVADLTLGDGMDGLRFAAEARRRWPGIGVVYATGRPDLFEGRVLGPAERYVLKPYTSAALLQVVRRVMPRNLQRCAMDQIWQKGTTRNLSLPVREP